MSPPQKAAITAATDAFDQLTKTAPQTLGEQRDQSARLAIIGPLVFLFDVSDADCRVDVLAVRLSSQRRVTNERAKLGVSRSSKHSYGFSLATGSSPPAMVVRLRMTDGSILFETNFTWPSANATNAPLRWCEDNILGESAFVSPG